MCYKWLCLHEDDIAVHPCGMYEVVARMAELRGVSEGLWKAQLWDNAGEVYGVVQEPAHCSSSNVT